jgi:hypothetical protein
MKDLNLKNKAELSAWLERTADTRGLLQYAMNALLSRPSPERFIINRYKTWAYARQELNLRQINIGQAEREAKEFLANINLAFEIIKDIERKLGEKPK